MEEQHGVTIRNDHRADWSPRRAVKKAASRFRDWLPVLS
jgi:hypothetical protein